MVNFPTGRPLARPLPAAGGLRPSPAFCLPLGARLRLRLARLRHGALAPLALALPSLLTLAGLALGLAGVVAFPSPVAALCLLASLACDAADGYAARALGAATVFGGRFDWHTDTALAALLAWVGPWRHPMLFVVLVVAQAATDGTRWKCSGRTWLTVAAVGYLAHGYGRARGWIS